MRYEDFEARMLGLLACDAVSSRVDGASQWWTTFPLLLLNNYEVAALLETPVIVGVSIVPTGLLTKYAVETDMATNPRKLKRRDASLFTPRMDAKTRRMMCSKNLPSRNRSKKKPIGPDVTPWATRLLRYAGIAD